MIPDRIGIRLHRFEGECAVRQGRKKSKAFGR